LNGTKVGASTIFLSIINFQEVEMITQGIHHVSINVLDVEAAKKFYIEILDLQDLPRPDLGFPGAWLKAGNQEIHLLGIDSGQPLKEQHFAFLVSDIDAVSSTLSEHQVEYSKEIRIPDVCRQIFAHDPSGNMIEFNQRLE
jgi:catechol 2,3-dioxygenase-like lactoylglutathione lyase family enzyme